MKNEMKSEITSEKQIDYMSKMFLDNLYDEFIEFETIKDADDIFGMIGDVDYDDSVYELIYEEYNEEIKTFNIMIDEYDFQEGRLEDAESDLYYCDENSEDEEECECEVEYQEERKEEHENNMLNYISNLLLQREDKIKKIIRIKKLESLIEE